MSLDDLDLKILNLLLQDGRISHTAIGKEIDLSGPSVYARIQRMEREGIIKGYTALLAPEQVGRGLAAFVRVRTQTPDYDSDLFVRFIQEEDQIVECHDIDGEDCYILKVRTTSTQSLQKLLTTIRNFPGITRTVTTIALETLKEKGTVRPAITKTKREEG
ncbi:MAG TPA: Lrp/AsnC family transcriptional regulator [Ktedonobacteraceae bacterium]|nr:Lrp/AsnC family transcriptional regulator [Ktedonobacteraceae bacterium]